MNDTRIVHALNGIDDVAAVLRDVLGDNGGVRSADVQAVEFALRSLAEARWYVADAAEGMVCHYRQSCRMPLGHPGPHQAVL